MVREEGHDGSPTAGFTPGFEIRTYGPRLQVSARGLPSLDGAPTTAEPALPHGETPDGEDRWNKITTTAEFHNFIVYPRRFPKNRTCRANMGDSPDESRVSA
ncbi:MAG: hypothetical protein HQL39_07700 [Alphaproteobacteria bacterium]|nr:hypothetical protein [Alphaproteobacteria bacterium]MBF0373290.1 hypothetical protein [Alphaproteobacteria bacterium]